MKILKLNYLFSFFMTGLLMSCAVHNNGIVAHRGAWKNNKLPENSIAALRHAIDLKLAGSEFDVWRTADDSLVINHDPHYHKLLIEDTNYAELVKFKLSNQEKLPTLSEYLKEGMRNNVHTLLVCEIKPSSISKERGRQTAIKVVEAIKKFKADKNSCYISFDYDILKQIRELDKKTVLQYLDGKKAPLEVKADQISGIDYHHSVFKKNPQWIKEAKENDIILNVWTVNEASDMDWFISQKFNYITTNEPELLKERLKGKN